MPDALPNPSASTTSTAREVRGGSPIRVLIVDDNAPVRRGIRLVLSSVAHVSICGEAADGIEAIEKAAELRPDLVLMDITMPRKDGLQATLAIKQALPGTRVILVSQNDPGLVQLQAAETNADGCVVKSELWQQLIPAIGNSFSKPSVEPGPRKKSRTAPPRLTASRQAEEATGLLAAIVASSDDAIVSKDLNGIITSWNKSAERLFGYTAQEAIGRHITLIIPHNRLNDEDEILSRIRRGERVDHFETIRVRKDGTTIEVSLTISPILDQDGLVIGASKVARDISERKRVEKALRLSEERERKMTADALAATAKFRAVFEQTTVFAGIMTKEGVLIEANRISLEACGYHADEVLGRPFWETAWWRNFPESQEKIRNAITPCARGIPYRETLMYSWASGAKRMVNFALHPIVDDRGEVLYLHPTGVDITDIKLVEERYRKLSETLDAEVRARTRELEQRNADVLKQSEQLRELSRRLLRAQDEERRHIARELHDSAGQTLTVLGMSVSHLAEQVAPDDGLASQTALIQDLVQQLHREIRTASYLLHPPMLDENGLAPALSWYVQGLSERSGLEINLEIAKDFGRLPGDIELVVFRLVQECLTNIHRHSGSRTASIGIVRDDDTLKVEVRDQGQGMSREKLTELQSSGSGVGIRGMRERLRHLWGKLNIESGSAGTVILAEIPIPKQALAQQVVATEPAWQIH